MSNDKNIEKIENKKEIEFKGKQRDVYDYSFSEKGKNLLVSAAAGSGKTRVLVEKIIDMISNPKNPDKTTLDKMLIMTFTVKATFEMKSRIKKALETKLSEDNLSDDLIREAATIQNANITTIDSFCKRMVEEYYTELDKKEKSLYKNFDPSYRIADEKELSILYNDILDDFLENEVYAKDKNGLYVYDEFLQAFFKKNSDQKIREMLLDGIKFLTSLAWPVDKLDEWINNKPNKPSNSNLEKLNRDLKEEIKTIREIEGFKEAANDMKDAFKNELSNAEREYNEYSKETNKDDEELEKKREACKKSESRLEKHSKIISIILKLYGELSVNDLNVDKFIVDFVNNRLDEGNLLISGVSDVKMVKKAGVDSTHKKKYTDAYNKVSHMEKLVSLKTSIVEETAKIKFADNVVETTYIKLLKEFYNRVVKEKVRRNIYAIGDYANLTLDILYDDDHKKVSEFTNNNIKNKYEYIFVDEYQDTNDIQDCIIKAISNGKNVFMVGDVKQSIYGFRNANPEIFVKKFNSYNGINSKDGKNNGEEIEDGEAIVMDVSYRSTFKIMGFVNEIFNKCMTKDFGRIDYKKDGKLAEPTEENSGLKKEEIEKRKNGKEVEVYIVSDENKNDKTKSVKNLVAKLDAEAVSRRIIKLHDEEKIAYKDIVVLLRNPASRVNFYMDAFSRHNIPCYLELKKGFFNRVEIRFMVDILNIIDNDRQDIPFANVLTSDIIGITNQELTFIKYAHMMSTENKRARLVDDIDYFFNYIKYISDDNFAETIKKENDEKKSSLKEETEKYVKNKKSEKDFSEEKYRKEMQKRLEDIEGREPKIIEQVQKFREVCKEEYKDENGQTINIIDFKQLTEKLKSYKKIFEELRMKSRYLGISELINEVYSLTNIKNIMASMNDGIMRNSNLDSLYEFAKEYEATSFVGLFNFMRYIEKIKKLDDDRGLAKTSDENDDVVRIMSIHASKGLEFKCVILAGCGSHYNEKDLERNVTVQFHSKEGIAMDGYDLEKKYCIETDKKLNIKAIKAKALYEEEMRVLYVALTRAKERLIVIGGVHNSGRKAMSYSEALEYYNLIEEAKNATKEDDIAEKTAKIKMEKDNECKSYLQLILNNFEPKSENCTLKMESINVFDTSKRVEDDLTLEKIVDESEGDLEAENALLSGNKNDISMFEKLDSEHLNKNLDYTYEYSDYQKIDKAKMSVSDIKKEKHDIELFEKLRLSDVSNSKLYDNDEGSDDDKEKNAESERISEKLSTKEEKKFSTERGNAYHRYMQFYDYGKNEFTGEIGNGVVGNKPWIDIVKPDKIKAFLNTNLGKEMAEAFKKEELYREHKFMKLFSVDDINEYREKIENTTITIKKDLSKEHNIIIQGIIDAFYIKKDGNDEYAVLVDYKTDGLSSKNINEKELEEELKNEYKIQLDIYADVLKELTGLKVKHKYIYSFALDKAIDLEEK